jgi:hypothetical protein
VERRKYMSVTRAKLYALVRRDGNAIAKPMAVPAENAKHECSLSISAYLHTLY